MKLTIEREKLNRGLQIVSKVVSTRPSLPILSNVLLTTENKGLKITSTDLDLGITAWVPAEVETEGSFTLPARILGEFVSNNTDQTIQLQVKNNTKSELTSEKFQASITGIASEEFPNIPDVEGSLEITLNLETLTSAVRQVVIACAIDDIRPALAGVYFKFTDKLLTVVATDSFRLGEKRIPLDLDVPNKEIIIPARTIHEFIRISSLLAGEEKVKIILGEGQLRLQFAQINLISRIIEATFPAYEKIIPTESVIDISANASELQTALRASRIFSLTGSSNIRLEVKDQSVAISSLTTERGQTQSQINAQVNHHGAEKEIIVAYNARYLADAITACGSDQVVIFITGVKKPTIVRDPDDPHYQHLVMPVDIKE